jgi:hypothetical protein
VSEVAQRAAEEFLAAAYPDERERERAERWLGIMACQGGERILWWEIPGLAPARVVLLVRRVVLGVAVVAVIGWGSYVGLAESTTGLVGAYGGNGADDVRDRLARAYRPRRGAVIAREAPGLTPGPVAARRAVEEALHGEGRGPSCHRARP